ncbi:MAG TPA: dephospho-CoA kinase [Pseudonocardia sp.]|uniref:dephospho-CoA kinase n=1 Tax=Pseudonocardia sp. TaxID=60912 RepID=UPI002CE3CD8B|nr:dephospho-CoA kinase [Pseudonocardia sp.]HTF49913.1 dephospho-CoA kinase [Pseudonocardia sp.]
MLRIGLTGGIGAGKSTVARRLVELGATLVDADVIAREVVQPGSPGLASVVAAFGEEVLDELGALNRPKLASIVFGDPDARRRLNGIVHPLVGQRTAELVAAAAEDAVLVQDIPLLVEGSLAPAFALVVVVHAAEEERVRRLVADRGMTAEDARARIAAQADEAARRAAADVWLDNSGTPDTVLAEVDRLWQERLRPFEANLRLDRSPPPAPSRLVEPEAGWPAQYARLAARIRHAVGDAATAVAHIGPTSVPGLPAPDLLHIQLGVASLEVADELRPALRAAGFVRMAEASRRDPVPDPGDGATRTYASADPGRPAELLVRPVDSAEHRNALLQRDWLRAEPKAREEYVATMRRDGAAGGQDAVGQAWGDGARIEADRWARHTGWRIPEPGPAHTSSAGL